MSAAWASSSVRLADFTRTTAFRWTLVVAATFVLCILVLFVAAYYQVNHFGPEQLKIYIGFIETFFGIYVGAISDHLFGPLQRKRASVSARRKPA